MTHVALQRHAWSRDGDMLHLDMTYEMLNRSISRLLAGVLELGDAT